MTEVCSDGYATNYFDHYPMNISEDSTQLCVHFVVELL
jgi:hypothetical protein